MPPPRCAAATTPGLSSRRGPRGPSGRERDRMPRLELAHRAEQGPGSAPRARAPDRPIAERRPRNRPGTDLHAPRSPRCATPWSPVLPEERQQRLVPEQEHDAADRASCSAPPPLLVRGPDAPGRGEDPERRAGAGTRAARGGTFSRTRQQLVGQRHHARSVAPGLAQPLRGPGPALRAARSCAGSRGSSSGRSASASGRRLRLDPAASRARLRARRPD